MERSAVSSFHQDLNQLLKAAFGNSPIYRLEPEAHPESFRMHNKASTRSTLHDTIQCKILSTVSHAMRATGLSGFPDEARYPTLNSVQQHMHLQRGPYPALPCHSCTCWLLPVHIANGQPASFSSVLLRTGIPPGMEISSWLLATCLL